MQEASLHILIQLCSVFEGRPRTGRVGFNQEWILSGMHNLGKKGKETKREYS